MVSHRRRDDRPIGRRGPTRKPKLRILIVSEGQVTEPRYFKSFQHEVRNPLVHVEVASETGVPRTVVEIAIRLAEEAAREANRQRDENLQWDEVWGVFDVDEHPNIDQARQLAKVHNVRLAISNPCFELWALLHFENQRAHVERHRVRAALQRHLPGYDKALDFAKIYPGYPDAVRRARELEQKAAQHGRPGRNPTTGVFCLTELIRSGGNL